MCVFIVSLLYLHFVEICKYIAYNNNNNRRVLTFTLIIKVLLIII